MRWKRHSAGLEMQLALQVVNSPGNLNRQTTSARPTHHAYERAKLMTNAGQGVSLQALIDPKDVERKPKSPSIGHAVPRRRPLRFQSILRRLFRLSSRQAGAGGFSRRPSTYHDPAEERERHRRSRDEFLERRKQRGSIMYSKGKAARSNFVRSSHSVADTGLAQIPLYAAPSTAEVASAPALSSFAPRAPLQPRNVNKAPPDPSAGWNIAVAKASATVDRDGNILEVKKEKAYKRGNARYSAFVQGQQKQGLVIPTEPLPTSRSSSPAAAMHAS